MNELTGTVTLAYVEEDNRQRMIFRIVPLCTKEGSLFHGTKEEFPDEGSLRIVPDKREQGTFKERMHSLCGMCAIALPADGKEKMKIRQNRNYSPDNGEKNQNALYSDVICEFAEDGCFEVIEFGSSPASALTPNVLVRKDMMLYGPLSSKEAGHAELSSLKPFGNDNYLLHIIDSPFTGKHQIYWNPDMLINWRQHKISGKRKDRPTLEEAALKKAVETPIKSAAPSPKPAELPAKRGEKKPAFPIKPENGKFSRKSPMEEKLPKSATEDRSPKSFTKERCTKPTAEERASKPIAGEKMPNPAVEERLPKSSAEERFPKTTPEERFPKSAEEENFPKTVMGENFSNSNAEEKYPQPTAEEGLPKADIEEKSSKAAIEEKSAKVSATEKPQREVTAEKPQKAIPEGKRQKPAQNAISDKKGTSKPAPVSAPTKPGTQPSVSDTEADAVLPIGESLSILDSDISFDQQLDRLTQPLSVNANRLSNIAIKSPADDVSEEESDDEEYESSCSHGKATKLRSNPAGRLGRAHSAVNVYQVVERTLHSKEDGINPEYIANPLSALRDCLDTLSQDKELHKQAISMLINDGEFMDAIYDALMKEGVDLRMRAAAEEQLSAIMAERLELLMQLRTAREDEKKYQTEALAKVSQKRRAEADHLKKDLERMRQEKNHLQTEEKVLSTQNQQLIHNYIANNAASIGSLSTNETVLFPVVGAQYDMDLLAENLRINLNNSGFSISEDYVKSFLIAFGLFDAIFLSAKIPADAYRFARVLLGSLGLDGVSAVLQKGSKITRISMLDNNPDLTPTVSIQPTGTDHLCAQGHKVIYIETSVFPEKDVFADIMCYPAILVPAIGKNTIAEPDVSIKLPEPVSLSSLVNVGGSKNLLSEAEKWLRELQDRLQRGGITVPDSLFVSMRQFIMSASAALRGGFPAAADIAVCLWIVPILMENPSGKELLNGFSNGLSRTMSILRGENP